MNRTMPRQEMAAAADFESWLVAREGALQRTAYLLAGDPHTAQDLVQATLTKLYLAWDRIDRRDQVDAYARKILVNEHRGSWRRASRRREVVTDTPPDRAADHHEYDGARDAMWVAVGSLAPRQRAVIVLRYYEDLTEAQTAELLGVSVGTVKSQAHKALASLRQRVGEEDR